jgi:adenosylhomocysteine nucleosidase
VVAALHAEARCLAAAEPRSARAANLLIRTSGIGRELAARSAEELLRAGAEALLCFGVGGALDPLLCCGDIVLATEVLSDAARLPTYPQWLRQLETALQGSATVRVGAVLTGDELVCSVERKQALFAGTGALVVDMESAAVAGVARRAGVPFMALRVVADTASDQLPVILQRLLATGSKRAGSKRAGAGTLGGGSWWRLACFPGSWPALARLGGRYRVALRVLAACARAGVSLRSEAALAADAALAHAATPRLT